MLQPGREQLIGETIEGKYHLTRYIGAGAFGVVYEASETFAGESVGRVAVKLISPQDEAQSAGLIREVRALAQLLHGNLLTYRSSGAADTGRLRGAFFIVTELADGSLDDALSRGDGPVVVRDVATGMASALTYLETRGAVHRDIKPANILRAGGVWKLADFGLARGVSGPFSTATGVRGTLAYMAPEMLEGQVGPASDVYSLGVTLLQCLTGRLAHEGRTEGEFIRNVLTRPAMIPSGLPEPWRTVLPASLAREPQDRCSAAELATMLSADRPRPGRAPSAAPHSPQPHPPQPARGAPAVAMPAPVGQRRAAGGHSGPWNREGRHVGEEITGPDGGVYVWVPPGEFRMGSKYVDWEMPVHRVRITRGYWLGKHEVTNAQYRAFCEATHREFPRNSNLEASHPVVSVNWDGAVAYADYYGLTLLSEAEWEYAARGPKGHSYPWGRRWEPQRLCWGKNKGPRGRTFPVGSFTAGVSWCGALDMAGNVSEWCRDWHDEDYYRRSPQTDPQGPETGDKRVARGGSWVSEGPESFRGAARHGENPSQGSTLVGFRCAVRPT